MPSTKICPTAKSHWPEIPSSPWLETPLHNSFRFNAITTSPLAEDCLVGYRHERDYWQARRAFLTSYSLSAERKSLGWSFKDKMKKSVKGLNEMAMAVVLEVRQVSRRRIGVRVYRFTLAWPSFFIVRCFVPWPYKEQRYLSPEDPQLSP
ncbi:hypothetical protein NMG60_11028308 [Bertholletia excelsa]